MENTKIITIIYWVKVCCIQKLHQKTRKNTPERMIQHETIEMRAIKLKIATNNVESTIKSHPVRDQELEVHRWKYTPIKEKIDRTIEALKEW